jgi:hypothetical protein
MIIFYMLAQLLQQSFVFVRFDIFFAEEGSSLRLTD